MAERADARFTARAEEREPVSLTALTCRVARSIAPLFLRRVPSAVSIELALTRVDAAAHCAGEDEETVRWLTGGYGTVEGTAAYFDWLDNAAAEQGVRRSGSTSKT